MTNADIRDPSKKMAAFLKEAKSQHLFDAYLSLYGLKMDNSDYDAAVGLLNEFLQFQTASDDLAGQVEVLNRIGMHYYYALNPTQALSFLTKADTLAAKMEPRRISSIKDNIASAYFILGKVDEAMEVNRTAFQILSKSLRSSDTRDEDLETMQNNFGAMLEKKGETKNRFRFFRTS